MKSIKLLSCLIIFSFPVFSQTPNNYQPYSFHWLQKLDATIYDTDAKFHSAIKPVFLDDSLLAAPARALLNAGVDTSRSTWVARKIFNEHLLKIEREDFTVYADFLADFQVGYDSQRGDATWLNTRGFQLGGTIGRKFSFYTSGFENQARLPGYLTTFVLKEDIIPGQGVESHVLTGRPKTIEDWAYSSAVLSYSPVKYLNITLGQDKNFIGDGYRSMVLSDVASNYPFVKTTFELGNVKYFAMWAQMQDPKSPQFSYDSGFRKKWGVFHYADWNVNDRLSLGFFESVIWQDADSTGKRGFDMSYLNPLIFLRPVEKQNSSPDNSMLGLNVKYELFKRTAIYSQFMLDEFIASEFFSRSGDWRNKWGLQLGIRGSNPLAISGLQYLLEFNTSRPYTYSQRSSLLNYGHYNQPLAHPMGANFNEFVTLWQYGYKRFNIIGQINAARYGLDEAGKNYGKNIFRSYDDQRIGDTENRITQGIKTDFLYVDGRISYLLNPKTNLRLELGGVIRQEKNDLGRDNTKWLTFSLRSSFRNLYQDF